MTDPDRAAAVSLVLSPERITGETLHLGTPARCAHLEKAGRLAWEAGCSASKPWADFMASSWPFTGLLTVFNSLREELEGPKAGSFLFTRGLRMPQLGWAATVSERSHFLLRPC